MVFVAVSGMGSSIAGAQAKKPAPAAAVSLTGTWRAGGTSMDVEVESWGADCGPRPTSNRSSGGGVVTVLHEGKRISIKSRDSEVRSDACWSRNPSMRRTSSSLVDNVWTTQCRTAQNDPREEQGTYVLKVLGPDTLLYQDKSRYNWALNASKCIATFVTTQTLTRVRDGQPVLPKAVSAVTLQPNTAQPPQPTAATTTKPTPAAAVVEAPENKCTPGAPNQITIRPKHAEIEVGQRVCFRARVTDVADCAIPSPNVDWSLQHSRSLRAELSGGCFTAAATTAEAEGEFKVIASVAGLRSEAGVSVRSVDLSALIAKRVEGNGLTGFEEQKAQVVAPKAASRIATRSVSETPKQDKTPMWAALGAAVLVLGGLSAYFLRRKPATSGTRNVTPTTSLAPAAPVAARRSAPPTMLSERPASRSSAPPTAHGAEAWICPLCRLGYPAHQQTCPRDGSTLLPYAEFSQRSQQSSQEKQKRCPKCGTLFPANASFCAEDGASLVDT